MNSILAFMILLLICTAGFAQDTIYLHTAEAIPSQVLEITVEEVKFKKMSNLNGPIYTYTKKMISKIRYENGSEEVFDNFTYYQPHEIVKTDSLAISHPTNMYVRGQRDASHFYTNYQGAQIGTGVTASLAGPVMGLIPAVILSSTPPKDFNLNYPDPTLIQNHDYYIGYSTEAQRIKAKKTWKGYGIGTLGYIVIMLMIISTHGS